MSNFYIGQDIVTLVGTEYLEKGSIRKILAGGGCTCKCAGNEYDIGVRDTEDWPRLCSNCNYNDVVETKVIWYHESEIAPLQTQSEEADMNAALEEIMERELFV